jgi:hypothetical protein
MISRLKERLGDTLLAWASKLYKGSRTPDRPGHLCFKESHPVWALGEPERDASKSHVEAVKAASSEWKKHLTPAQQLELYEKVMENQFVSMKPMERAHLTVWQRQQKAKLIVDALRRDRNWNGAFWSEYTIERVAAALREDCERAGANRPPAGDGGS